MIRKAFVSVAALVVLALAASVLGAVHYAPHKRKYFQPAAPAGGGSASKPANVFMWFKPESLTGSGGSAISTWTDSGSGGFNATSVATAEPTVSSAAFAGLNAASFNGSNQRLQTSSVSHGIGTGDFTWTAWVKPASLSIYKCFVANGGFSPGLYGQLSTATWGGYWSGDLSSGAGLSTGTWYHLAMRRSGGTLTLWRNGAQVATFSVGTSMSDAVLTIGDNGAGGGWINGLIGEVSVWRRALTDQEIADDYSLRNP